MTAALETFESQAVACDDLGSPFTATLCRLLTDVLDDHTAFGRRLRHWPASARADAMALRACGALHALARSGQEPGLSAVYPPAPTDSASLEGAVRDAIGRHDAFLAAYLGSPPQTNEVARSGIILGGMLAIAARTGMPLEVLEIGASAGLNLGFDGYRYELGDGQSWGAADAPVTIACDWRGTPPAPLDTRLKVASRAGCDQNPLDPADPETVERLLSYVWPDQTVRMARLTAALGAAASSGGKVEAADAADWLEARLDMPQPAGRARVIVHTIMWQYMPASVQQRAADAIHAAGTRADANRPLAHLRFEADGSEPGGALTLTNWPDGDEAQLARADFHGRWVAWT
jgi:hypothetical protein